jgi:hypothetical protein
MASKKPNFQFPDPALDSHVLDVRGWAHPLPKKVWVAWPKKVWRKDGLE